MIKQKSIALVAAIFCFSLCFNQAGTAWAQEKELTVAELIAKHLDSIGKPEVRAKAKSRGITGRAAFEIIQGGSGRNSDGTFIFLSEGKNLGFTMDFKDINYLGEYVAYNGKETTVREMTTGHNKSPLGDFLFRYSAITKEGFLGGVMSVAWPLLGYKEGQPQDFTYKVEQIKNRKYHILEKHFGDVKVKLFFEDKTFRHVRTEYAVRIKNDISANSNVIGDLSADSSLSTSSTSGRVSTRVPQATIHEDDPDSIFTLTEKFDPFIDVGGLSLPAAYGIEFSAQGHGASFLGEWSIFPDKWIHNGAKIDQSFFVAK